ncbi:hypothetical protein BTR25_22240 [Bacillus sp. MRMR6]|nr:hypothetical protein BTR25_22240 [Bacillus sp. MRMR6]
MGGVVMVKNDEKMLAAVLYVLSLFAPIVGPLIIWLLKKEESSFVDYHGKEYFNFFISYFIYSLVSGILVFLIIGIFLLWILGIMALVFTIIAAVKAYEGNEYKFPLIIRFIK